MLTQDANNVVIASIAFACTSGDTQSVQNGTQRLASIPAATAAAIVFDDNSDLPSLSLRVQIGLSASRNWATVGLELRSGGSATPLVDYASTAAADMQTHQDFRFISDQMPLIAGSISEFGLSPVSFPNGSVSVAYSVTMLAIGGTPAYTYAVTSGSLPSGLTLHGSTGVLDGTPTTLGISSFTVTATDSHGRNTSRAYTLTIGPPGGGGSYAFIA